MDVTSCVLMVSLFVAISVNGERETLRISSEPVAPATLEACATQRAAKIAELRAGPDAKKYRSYQILCVQVGP